MLVLGHRWPLLNPTTPTFTDVPRDFWAYTYIETAHAHDVINGYAGGTFRPMDNVTRGQLAKMLVQSQGWRLLHPSQTTFTDVGTSHWAYEWIETVAAHGVATGFGDHTFRPTHFATRAQLSKTLYLALTTPDPTLWTTKKSTSRADDPGGGGGGPRPRGAARYAPARGRDVRGILAGIGRTRAASSMSPSRSTTKRWWCCKTSPCTACANTICCPSMAGPHRLHPARAHRRGEQAGPPDRHASPAAPGAGAADQPDRRRADGAAQPAGLRGGDRSRALCA